MFLDSGCPEQGDPILTASPIGPLCRACPRLPRFQTRQELLDAVDAYLTNVDMPLTRRLNPVATYGPIEAWEVSNITDFSLVFSSSRNSDPSFVAAVESFNADISAWNVSEATNLELMFYGANSFNQDLSSWEVSKVTSMYGTFALSLAFNAPSIQASIPS